MSNRFFFLSFFFVVMVFRQKTPPRLIEAPPTPPTFFSAPHASTLSSPHVFDPELRLWRVDRSVEPPLEGESSNKKTRMLLSSSARCCSDQAVSFTLDCTCRVTPSISDRRIEDIRERDIYVALHSFRVSKEIAEESLAFVVCFASFKTTQINAPKAFFLSVGLPPCCSSAFFCATCRPNRAKQRGPALEANEK